jgi:hypothetical protein
VVTPACDDSRTMKPREVSDEDHLAALNELIQSGLAEVVMIEDGEPFYRLASSFTVPAAPESSA